MEQTKKGSVDTLRIAATYIGTVVGAGFASGQEILQFFTVFGSPGYAGLLIATIMFIVFGNSGLKQFRISFNINSIFTRFFLFPT